MLPKTSEDSIGKVLFLTSTISGEGKSFVSMNLAAALALTNKKVLITAGQILVHGNGEMVNEYQRMLLLI